MRPQRWFVPVLLLLLAVVPHLGALRNDFAYDDRGVILENPAVRGFDIGALWGGPYWPGTPETGLYRPIVSTTYALNWALTPGRPSSFAFTNILLHAITTLIAYGLIRGIFPGRSGLAAASAALFAVHPIHVEAVAGIVGRAELLASIFSLLAYLAWLREEKRGSKPAGILPAMLWLAALLSKESAAGLPLILAAHRLGWLPGGSEGKRIRYADLAWPAALAVALLLRWNALGTEIAHESLWLYNPLAELNPLLRALGACGVLALQVLQILIPHGFSCDYSYAQVDPGASLYLLGGTMLLILALGSWVAIARGKRTPAGWGFAFFVASWIVTSNLILPIGTARADRLLYQPLLGIAVLAVAGASGVLARRAIRWRVPILAVVTIGFAIGSAVRTRDWRDDVSIFSSAVREAPRSVKARSNLAMLILRAQTPESARRAIAVVEPVMGIGERYGPLVQREAKARMFLGEYDRAGELFRKAIRSGADSSEVLIELGNIALATNDGAGALACFELADPAGRLKRNAEIGRASALSLLGRYKESADLWTVVAAALPDSAPVRIAYAWNLRADGRTERAEMVLRDGLARREDHRLWDALARTQLGDPSRSEEALRSAERSVAILPTTANLTTLARAQISAGRTPEAMTTRSRIIEPDSLRRIDSLLSVPQPTR